MNTHAARRSDALMESMQESSRSSMHKASQTRSANLATRRTVSRTDPRLAVRRLRVAFIGIVSDARRMPDRFYTLTRERECAYPFERERDYIHTAIREGATSPERVIAYRLAQMADDLEQFDEAPPLESLCYRQWLAEQGEAVDAVSLVHALPSDAHRDRAIREVGEASLVGRVLCSVLQSGRKLLHGVS